MSIGNTNFITLDSIAEIQDIADGDYVFTVSNGVIYKLDFQNFVIPLQNVDFASTIESMSAQLVSLTNAFSAMNSTVNALSGLTAIPSLSSNWTSTYRTVNALSGTNWLPNLDSVSPGSVIYYSGGSTGFKYTPSGKEGNVLTVNKAIPTFAGSSTYGGIHAESITYEYTDIVSADFPTIEIMSFSTQEEYAALQISWSVDWQGGSIANTAVPVSASTGSAKTYTSTIKDLSRLYVEYDGSAGVPNQVFSKGLVHLSQGTSGSLPVSIQVIPQFNVTLDSDEKALFGGSAQKYPVGSASALGDTGSAVTRWKETDPNIIETVNSGEIPGGLPSTNSQIPYIWDFDAVWSHARANQPGISEGEVSRRYGNRGPVYTKCRVTLIIQGR